MERSIEKIREDFPFLDTDIIYLDNGATALIPNQGIQAMEEYFKEYNANIGRGVHSSTKKASRKFEEAREKVANLMNADMNELAFTKNATESLNILSNGLGLSSGDKVVTSFLEHHSNLIPWQNLIHEKGVDLEVVEEHEEMVIEPSAIDSAIDENTKLITLTHVSNAFGTRQPVKEISKIAEENDIYFALDASQSLGYQPLDVKEIGCDFLAAPGHKGLLGPQGTGVLYLEESVQEGVKPLTYGGGMVTSVEEERCDLVEPPQLFEAGTPNIPGCIALGRTVDYLREIGLDNVRERKEKLTDYLLKMDEFENVEVYGPKESNKLGGIVSFNVKDLDPHEVSSILDETENIATRSGYHCAEPAMGRLGIGGNVRASVNFYNTLDEVKTCVGVVSKIESELV